MTPRQLNAKVRGHRYVQHNQGDAIEIEFTIHPDIEIPEAANKPFKLELPVKVALKEYPLGSCHYLGLHGSQKEFDFEPEPATEPEDPAQESLGISGGVSKGRGRGRSSASATAH